MVWLRHWTVFTSIIAYDSIVICLFATPGFAKKNAAKNNNNHNQKQQQYKAVSNDNDFIFLTFFNGTDSNLIVNLVEGNAGNKKQLPTLESSQQQLSGNGKVGQQQQKFQKQFMVLQEETIVLSSFTRNVNSKNNNKMLPLLSAKSVQMAATNDGSIQYQIKGFTQGQGQSWPLFLDGRDKYQLRVCVFGDFTQSLYEDSKLNLSGLIQAEGCQMNLFIGKIAWDRQQKPKPNFNFSPYVMLHSAQDASKHQAFAHIPSLFGGTGGNQTETSYFQCTEVGDVAFIQITVEIATSATLPDGTEAYEMIAQYFRETMLNELECKLQELHRRPKRPWIVLYMTHPYLTRGDDNNVQWFIMNDTSRFFDILKRYKVDLLTSCGIEGMARMLAAERLQMPDAKLPEYIQTTMAQCGGYASLDVTLQNECTYAVLDIKPDVMHFEKKMAEEESGGNKMAGGKNKKTKKAATTTKGQIQRTFEEADQCVPFDEL